MRKLFFYLLLTLIASQASAQVPIKTCSDGRQVFANADCYQRASARSNYAGAIAHAKGTKFFSWSNNYSSRSKAEAATLETCRKDNPSGACYIVDSFFNQCVAVAVGPKYYAFAYSDKRVDAEKRAARTCRGTDKHQCEVEFSFCPD